METEIFINWNSYKAEMEALQEEYGYMIVRSLASYAEQFRRDMYKRITNNAYEYAIMLICMHWYHGHYDLNIESIGAMNCIYRYLSRFYTSDNLNITFDWDKAEECDDNAEDVMWKIYDCYILERGFWR